MNILKSLKGIFNFDRKDQQHGNKRNFEEEQSFVVDDFSYNHLAERFPSATGNLKAEYFYLAQTNGICYKCKNETLLNGLVLPEGFLSLEDETETEPIYSTRLFHLNDYFSLLSYIDYISNDALEEIEKYTNNYDLCYSRTMGSSYYMSRCHTCSAAQGDHFSMNEHDAPFAPTDVENFSRIDFKQILIPIEVQAASVGLGYPPIEYYLGDDSVNGLLYARSLS